MKGLSATQGGVGIDGLVNLRECVEETPGIPGTELLVVGRAPLCQDMGNLRRRDSGTIHRPDRKIVGEPVLNGCVLVGRDPTIQMAEPVAQLAHGPGGEMAEIAIGIFGMLATDLHLTGECEVIANPYSGPCDQAGWIRLVVRIAQTDDPAEVGRITLALSDLKDPEIPSSFMTESMSLLFDGEPAADELRGHLVKDRAVAEGIPGFCTGRSGHSVEEFPGYGFGSTMKQHASGGSLDGGTFDDVHMME